MQTPAEVTSVTTSDGTDFEMQPGVPLRVRNVVFYIGRQGPFRKVYKLGEYSAERVIADMQAEVDNLKAIGPVAL